MPRVGARQGMPWQEVDKRAQAPMQLIRALFKAAYGGTAAFKIDVKAAIAAYEMAGAQNQAAKAAPQGGVGWRIGSPQR